MKEIHPFHCIMDNKTILELMKAGGLKEKRKLSRFIVHVFERFYWLIEQHHFSGFLQGCRYRFISDDLQDKRMPLWLPFPEKLYQRLKSIHKDLDYFSIAQVVRLVIQVYLKMRKSHTHEEVLEILDQNQERWYRIRENYKQKPQKKSHMNKKKAFSRKKMERYKVYYDENAVPLSIWRY